MNAEEKFEADVLLEFKNHKTVPWSVLISLMYFLFLFCVGLPGYSGFAILFLEDKYQLNRQMYDLVFLISTILLVSTLADLYGRRKICCILSTYMFVMFIPAIIVGYLEIKIAIRVVFLMKFYLMPCLILVYFINFLEISVKCNTVATMTLASGAIATVCATETLTLQMPSLYRKIALSFIITLPIFVSWYTPESPMWLLNKNKSRAVLQLLNELSGKKSDIAAPTNVREYEHGQFKIWKESVRYLFTQQWKNLILMSLVDVPPMVGIFTTRVVQLHVRSTVVARILLCLCCVFIIVVVFMVLRLRLGVICLNSGICLLEISHFFFLILEPSSSNKSVVIIWLQYVLNWSATVLSWMFAAEIFPTFVRGTALSLMVTFQYLTVVVLQISGCHDLSLANIFLSGGKILCYVFWGIIPWYYLRETPNTALANQKLNIS